MVISTMRRLASDPKGETCLQSVWGSLFFSEPYEEVDVVGQRKSLAFTPVMLLGQVSPYHPLNFTMTRKTLRSHPRLWRTQGNSTIQFRRCVRSTVFYGESKREFLPFNSIQKVYQEHGLSWRAQGTSVIQFNRCPRSTTFHGEPKGVLSFNSEGVSGTRPSMENPRGSSTIQFNSKGVTGTRPFMESPREFCHSIQQVCQEHGLPSMMIIMEFRKTHLV